ncbi:MAG TPA: SigE family RNA polymerase sigma factor [Acidimicrobiales bacterium]|nr:SigE family RNA polymerase sigma factor [Acidimicrobiales bacterium]
MASPASFPPGGQWQALPIDGALAIDQGDHVQTNDPEVGAGGFGEFAMVARPTLVRAALSVTSQQADAEDAVQASFVKALGAWQRVADQEPWRQRAYVRQIVVNTCRSSWRKWGSRVRVGEIPEMAPASRTEPVEDRDLVRSALARLPQRQRAVLVLRYYEDLPEAEIARRLGCAPGTVKSSASRALRALREVLAVELGPVPPTHAEADCIRGLPHRAAPAPMAVPRWRRRAG